MGAKQDEVDTGRITRERLTVAHMIDMYCQRHHAARAGLCRECEALRGYAMARLDRCVYGGDKPTCRKCPVHCYRQDMREQMRRVMVYAGPRMLVHHPVLAVRHLLDGRKAAPLHPRDIRRAV